MDDLIWDRNAKLAAFQQEIYTLKQTLSNNVKEKESLSKTLTVSKIESKEKVSKYIDKEIVLEKQNKELENIICKMYRSTQSMHMLTKPQVFYGDTHKQALGYQNMFHLKKARRIQPTLYDASVIAKEHAVIFVTDDEETLILEEKSRSKMLDKQNDPISIEKKIKISPIDYSKLNKIKEDFGKRFVTKKELSAEQALWLKYSSFFETPVTSHTPVKIEAPNELHKYTSLFIDTDSSDSDTPDLLPSQDPYEVSVSQWRSRVATRLSPPSLPIRQPIPIGRPYRTQPNGVLKMLTAKKRVGSLPTLRLALSHSSNSTSFDSYSRHSSSGYTISDSLNDSLTTASTRPSHKRCRSPTSSVHVVSPVHGSLSLVRDGLSPLPKRIRDSDLVTDFEVSSEDSYEPYVPREASLRVDVEDSYEPYTEPNIDSDIQADIDEYIAYADAIRARWTDDRDMVVTTGEEDVESRERDMVEVEVDPRVRPVIEDDVLESVREDDLDHVTADGVVEVTYETLGDLGHRITIVDLEVTTMTERISGLEQDNTRLIGMLDVESQRVDRLQRVVAVVLEIVDPAIELVMYSAMFDDYEIYLPIFYDMISMPTATRTEMSQDAINGLITKRVDEALKAYDAARNPGTEAKIKNEQQDDHIEENVNGNRNPNANNGGVVPVARECTYQDFVKCQLLNFKGTEGVVGLTRWFEKIETMFHISNCPLRYQVKYATCTLLFLPATITRMKLPHKILVFST
ncbi:hypothetical protein Tco_0781248 [Tanacetum coccineum]